MLHPAVFVTCIALVYTTELWHPEVCPVACVCETRFSIQMQAELRTVDCEGKGLSRVPHAKDIPISAQVLLLGRNRIRHVAVNRLWLPELLYLDLGTNHIKSFGAKTPFEGVYNLRELNLSNNRITSLRDNVFQGLTNLEELCLDNNRISIIADDAFRSLDKLEVLRLSNNRLTFLHRSWWTHLPSLYELKISRNQVALLQAQNFAALRNLLGLDLSSNKLFQISADSFAGLRKLEYLRLDQNRLMDVPSLSFSHISASLKSLSMNNNPIYRVDGHAFSSLPELRDLAMTKMHRLHLIDADAFNRLPQFLILELHDNARLRYVDPSAFSETPRLTHIMLHNNNLTSLSENIVFSLPSLEELTLYGNPIVCDCNAYWLKSAIDGNLEHTLIFKEAEKIVCAAPERHRYKVLSALDPLEIQPSCPPRILDMSEGEDHLIDAKFGDDVSIDCKAIGVPSPSTGWRLPSGTLLNAQLSDNRMSLRNGGSTLVIHSARTLDSGMYTCISENAHGQTTKDFHVTVSDFDVRLNVLRVGPNSVTLTWDGRDRNRGVFQILYRIDTPHSVHQYAGTVTPIMSSYTVSSLQPHTQYEVCIALDDQSQVMVHIACTKVTTKGLAYLVSGIERTSNIAVGTAMGIITCMLIVICLAFVGFKKNIQKGQYPPPSPSAMEDALLVPQTPTTPFTPFSLPKTPAEDNVYSAFFASTEKLLTRTPATPNGAVTHFKFPSV